jgi:hypothetical protein
VIDIPGTHDEFVAGFHGEFGGISIVPNSLHVNASADGRQAFRDARGTTPTRVVLERRARLSATSADAGYQFLLRLNRTDATWVRPALWPRLLVR